MQITMQGKYQTRGKRSLGGELVPVPVRILCVDGPSDEPVIGVIDGWDEPCQWTLDGHFWVSGVGSECDRDLIPAPTKYYGWGVVNKEGELIAGFSNNYARRDAIGYAGLFRGCSVVRLSWEN